MKYYDFVITVIFAIKYRIIFIKFKIYGKKMNFC